MYRLPVISGITSLALAVVFGSLVVAQDRGPRKLAPGVLKEIKPDLNPRDMYSLPMPLPGLDANQFQPVTIPNEETLYGQSHRVILYRDSVWEYEFSFLTLRQAELRMPDPDGGLTNRNVWYLVYRIRDTGATMTFDQVKQNPDFDHINYDLKMGAKIPGDKIDFRPRFTLHGSVKSGGKYEELSYSDVISPVALAQVRQIEDAKQQLLDTRQMATATIPAAQNDADPGVWGVAIWEDVDPRIDFVSVFVRGLTNAYRLDRDLNAPSKLKTLQLNFWRPGDQVAERRDDVIYGIPLVEDPREQALICERYQLPGPLLRIYEVNKLAKRDVLIAEVDAEVDLEDFTSKLTPVLDGGKLPVSLVNSMGKSGITVDQTATPTTIIAGRKWTLEDGGKSFIIQLEPRFWEPSFGKIRFIKTLDHMWIYR